MKYIYITLIVFFALISCSTINAINPMPNKDNETYDTIFLVTGDSRRGDLNTELKMTQLINDDGINYTLSRFGRIDGIFMTGDFVESGKKDKQWEEWIKAINKSFRYPIYPCIGNHDDEHLKCGWLPHYECYQLQYIFTNYYKTFGFADWYSTDVNNIHIVSISSNYDGDGEERIDEKQKEWLINDLKNNNKPITIALYHAPAYSSYSWMKQGHGSDMHMRETYSNIFEKYGTDIIFNGHTHWYERIQPILNNEYNENGLVRITIGGGGAPLTPSSWSSTDKIVDGNGKNVSAVNKTFYGYVVIAIKGDIIYGWAIKYLGHAVEDTFQIKCR